MIGQTISHYKILEKLGEGGMGVVYKAEDTKLDRIVALKFLPHHLTSSEAEQSRFLQEAKAAAALNHPNVCSVIDIQEANGQQFIVMEYVDGATLRKISPVAKLDEAIGYAIQIGEALQAAHAKGIVHRDVKSENVMVTTDGRVKVMDFGLAKLKGSLKLTKTSSTVGTLAYMAPEQIRGDESDARSDIFSFGVVLFEMLTGKLPFRGEHEAAMMYSIVNEDCDSVQKYRQDTSPELDRIIRRALEKDPEDRYQHVDDMTSEIRRLLKRSSKVHRPAPSDPVFHATHAGAVQHQQQVLGNAPLLSKVPSRPMYLAIAAVAIALVGIVSYIYFVPSVKTIDSLAVLPFVNASADPNTEYLSDGMTETIINSLTQIPELRVIPRSTVFRFKGSDMDPQEIGAKLNVQAVLAGRIVHRDNNLNLQLDLIDVDRQSQIYGNQYQHRATDILSMQEEIVSDLLEQLGVTLSKKDQQTVTKRYTDDVDAYTFYLQGRYYWNKRLPDKLKMGIGYFKQAIAKDPNYALAYAGLADSYTILGNYNLLPPQQTYPEAKAAAVKALSIDDGLAEAHASLGFAIMNYDWDWFAAERELKRAIEINPNYATARSWYAFLLTVTGRFEEATLVRKKSIDLDTLSPVIIADAGLTLYFARRYDEAIEQFRKALTIDPTFALAYVPLGGAYVQKKMYGEAIDAYQKFTMGLAYAHLSHPIPIAALGHAYAVSGRTDDALNYLELVEEMSTSQYVAPYWRGVLSIGLGKKEQALNWLEKAFEEHDGSMVFLKVDPVFDGIHSEPKFKALLKKMDLEQ